ncbi:MAG TPA: polyprenyl synthetase family protein [Dehalococcoidales bacterium]|nr:polyprenyl synthetase family protein [Dehalococcoidales bacterium]
MKLSKIYKPIQQDLVKVEEILASVTKVEPAWLAEMLDYSLSGGGKRIRPALALLSGKLHDYNLDYLLPMGVAVELMHTATLVHDDAIDNSLIRRSKPTINSAWGEEKAVLLGDYLFARSGEFAADTQNLRVVRLFSQTLAIISTGELEQTFTAFNTEQSWQDYLRRISRKTASLFSLATESGAILSQAPEESIEILRDYGYNLGIAFQIVDDILDFIGTEEELGKPVGSDLAQGTLTLPAILLMEQYPDDNPVKKLFNDEDRPKNIELALKMVRDSSIPETCCQMAADYCAKACRNLNLLPDNDSLQSLVQLAGFITERRR